MTVANDSTIQQPARGTAPKGRVTIRENLRRSLIDGCYWSVMIGAGELFLPAMVLLLSLGEVNSGWVVALPPMIGALVQLSGRWFVVRLGSHKRWVVLTVSVQAASWLPLTAITLAGEAPVWLLFACVVVYYAAGMAGGAAWSTWIGTVVPRRVRAKYFGRRNRAIQLFTLAGFLGGALALAVAGKGRAPGSAQSARDVLLVLAGMFALSGLARGVSAWYLARTDEPEPIPANHRHVPVRELVDSLRGGDGAPAAHLLIYIAGVWFASNIAAPFINPYLLGLHGEPYLSWASLVGLVMFGKIVTLGVLGGFRQRPGARRLLVLGGIGIVPIGGMWAASESYAWIVSVQVYSGMVWACWELGVWLTVLERFKDEQRTSLMGYYFLLNQTSMAVGALLGGCVLEAMGKDRGAYHAIFLASSLARLMTLGLLALVVLDRPSRVVPGPAPTGPRARDTTGPETQGWEEGRIGD